MPPSPAEADDDIDLWPDNTQERSFWKEAASVVVEGEDLVPALEESETTHAVATTTATDEDDSAPLQASGSTTTIRRPITRTDTIESHPSRSPSPALPSHRVLHTSSDEALWVEFPSDGLGAVELDPDEDDNDLEAVEKMIPSHESEDEDAEEGPQEEPELARTQDSFAFSVTHSRNTSMTSIMSTGESVNLRKRTLEDMEPSSVQSAPASPSKARRLSASTRDPTYTRSISLASGATHLIPGPPSGCRPFVPSVTIPAAAPPLAVHLLTGRPPTVPPPIVSPPTVPPPTCGWSGCTRIHTHVHAVRDTKPSEPEGEAVPEILGESSRSGATTAAHRLARPSSVAAVEPQSLHIIASDQRAQTLMDQHLLSWGVQYEIARGVVNGDWAWEDITEETVDQLKGSNAEAAPKVSFVLKGKHRETEIPLWAELDREEAAIIEHNGRGVGLQGPWHGEQNWYGGKIQQIARLVEPEKDADPPRVILEKMQMTRSHRFGRFLGSRRLLQLKLPKNTGSKHQKVLQSKFVLCGRVFVSLPDKDGKSYLLEVDEDYERSIQTPGDEHRMSLEDFVRWHNPMEFNGNQPVTKWAARFDLGLSTSVPALRFEPEHIVFIGDIYAEGSGPHPSTEQILTDGCGRINRAALAGISKNLDYDHRPTAVQGRIYGSKGLWLLDPTDVSPEPRIWIRHSQRKIKFGRESDTALAGLSPAQYIFDLVAPTHVTTPTRLSRHTIINLAHNGVPNSVFAALMRAGLEAEITPLMKWDGPNATQLLWNAVNKVTKTMSGLMQETAHGLQRAMGFSNWRDFGRDDEHVSLSSRYLPGGKPVMRGELCLRMLQAGFSPRTELFLHQQLRKIIRAKLDKDIKSCHIPILNSAEAFIAADPLGILEEGEIAFTSSKMLQDLDCEDPYTITGDVLLYRNPARLPSDIRKVKAVYHHELRNYTDVILLPTKGSRSLASLLAGGDLDGDVAVCIYEPSIVTAFENSPVVSQTPDLLENFEPTKSIQRVAGMKRALDRSSPSQARLKLQKCLLSGLSDSKVGIYSRFHEIAIYWFGYDDPKTIRIADIFNCLLDSRKTGHRLKKEVWEKDSRQYSSWDLPACLSEGEPSEFEPRNPIPRLDKRNFILDEMLESGKKILNDLLIRYDAQEKPEDVSDECIVAPYTNIANSTELAPEMRAIETFVRDLFKRWKKKTEEVAASKNSSDKRKKMPKGHKVDSSQKAWLDFTKKLAEDFAQGPPEDSTQKLRSMGKLDAVLAAYAYSIRPIFAYNIAFNTLCMIKAEPSNPVVFCSDFAVWFTMSKTAVRLLSQGSSSGSDGFDI